MSALAKEARNVGLENLPETAAVPLLSLRHARMSLAGRIRAKCAAGSKPMPVLAPTTTTVFPVRSVLSTAGTHDHCSRAKPRNVFFIVSRRVGFQSGDISLWQSMGRKLSLSRRTTHLALLKVVRGCMPTGHACLRQHRHMSYKAVRLVKSNCGLDHVKMLTKHTRIQTNMANGPYSYISSTKWW